jgi:hypothetical protein
MILLASTAFLATRTPEGKAGADPKYERHFA